MSKLSEVRAWGYANPGIYNMGQIAEGSGVARSTASEAVKMLIELEPANWQRLNGSPSDIRITAPQDLRPVHLSAPMVPYAQPLPLPPAPYPGPFPPWAETEPEPVRQAYDTSQHYQDASHPVTLEELVFTAVGLASMCWEPRPEGVFDSEEASKVGRELLRSLRARGAS